MFSGLVETTAPVVALRDEPPGVRLVVAALPIAADAKLGDSICVSGCCLTLVAIEDAARGWLAFQAGPETLSRTTLGGLRTGDAVNLERSLRASARLGGHFVTGHVDGVGTLVEREDHGDWSTIWFSAPAALMPHLASKGSVAVEGVSLTVVDVAADRFSVQLIPHTLRATTLGGKRQGDGVNLETDLLAKYVERQVRHSR